MSDSAPERTFSQAEVDRIVQDRLDRDRRVRVSSEPRVYALDSPHSFFHDAATMAENPHTETVAHKRMARYKVELAYEVEARSAEGHYVERVIRNQTRVPDDEEHRARYREAMMELRALTTGGGATAAASSSASVFVSPYFLLEEWAAYRGKYRSFADQCHILPIPQYGMQIYVPQWTSGTSTSQQTEGSSVSESDPASAFQNSQVVTVTGQITGTQQFHDRGGSGAGWTDSVIHRQLQQQLEASLDSYVLTTVLASAGTTLNNVAWTANSLVNFLTDIATAREAITDTAGTALRPTHLFSTSDFYSYVSHIVGSDGRPMLMPPQFPVQTTPILNGVDDGQNGGQAMPKWARFTGTVLPAGVLWFTDDNIPASGADTQVVVSAPDESIVLLESPDPVFSVFPQTQAGNLEIVFNLRAYACAITRHASGTQVISGGAYPTSNK